MKYLVKLFVVTFLIFASTYAMAEQKIVVLDLKYVLNESKAGKGAQQFLKKKFNDDSKKFTNMEKDLKKKEKDLLEQKTSLSKEDYKKKSNELRKKVGKFQKDRRNSLQKTGELRKNAKAELLKQLTPILDNYINENSISIVINKEYMIGGLDEFDITNEIVEKLNKEFPSLTLQ